MGQHPSTTRIGGRAADRGANAAAPGASPRRTGSDGSPALDPRPFLVGASFLSGAAALNYELLWVRQLSLVAGSTQAAISCVLTVYFLGLALGNALAGRFAARLRRPLLAYMGVELCVAAWALLFQPLLGGMSGFYRSLYLGLPAGSVWIHLLRSGAAAALLLVPTTCLGATLPLLAQFAPETTRGATRWSAVLYGANTLGAMTGVLATGFWLIPGLGVSHSLRLSALLNVLCALAVSAWRGAPGGAGGERARATGPVARTASDSALRRRILISFGVLGLANVALEVLWTQFYALIFPNDTYIFSTLLLMYLFGVGVGSLAGQYLLPSVRRPVFTLGVLQIVSAAATLSMAALAPMVAQPMAETAGGFGGRLGNYFITVGVGTILTTLCMGASFPILVSAALRKREEVGNVVGAALAWNTIGGVLGASLGGFVLVDRLGVQAGLLIVTGLTALVGALLCASTREGRRIVWAPLAGGGVVTALALIAFPLRIPEGLIALHFPIWAGFKILETRPSVHGTVTITDESLGIRKVWINDSWVASDRAHLSFGYVPWLLHRGPVRSALGICCGTGRTFGALLNAGIPDLDLVDINRAVVELSRKWLGYANHGVLSDPRPRVIIDDGRNFVRYSRKRYDVITLEPLQMYQKGVAYFYTVDFYRQARSRMNPGGVLCQWVPLYLLDPQQFRSVVRTFVEAFPNSVLWGRRGHSMVLLGFNAEGERPPLEADEIAARLAGREVQADLAHEDMSGRYDPLVYTLVDGPRLKLLSRSGDLYTDDRPILEFTSPGALYAPDENLALIGRNLAPLDELYPALNPEVAPELEALRRTYLEASLTSSNPEEMRARIASLRREIYGEGAGGSPAEPEPAPELGRP